MGRTPRNFDGIHLTGKKASELLQEALQKLGVKADHRLEEIAQKWVELLGEKMAPMTTPVSFADGVFVVSVKSATLYSLLCTHERPRLLKQLKEKFPIQKLVFRMG